MANSNREIEVGAEAVGTKNLAQELVWNERPVCCSVKVNAFDFGTYICGKCEKIHED